MRSPVLKSVFQRLLGLSQAPLGGGKIAIFDAESDLPHIVSRIAQGIIARSGDVAGAGTKAIATIDNLVNRQAYYMSYLDTFKLITVFFILVIPLVAFLRVKKKSKEEVAATMKAAADAH